MLISSLVCPAMTVITNRPLLIIRVSYLKLSSKQLANWNVSSFHLCRRENADIIGRGRADKQEGFQRVLTLLLIAEALSPSWTPVAQAHDCYAETANQAVQIIFKAVLLRRNRPTLIAHHPWFEFCHTKKWNIGISITLLAPSD